MSAAHEPSGSSAQSTGWSANRTLASELIVSVLLIAFGAWIWFAAGRIHAPVVVDPLGPTFWPKILGAAIAVLATVETLRVLLKHSRSGIVAAAPAAEEGEDDSGEGPFAPVRFFGTLVFLGLYLYGLKKLGYFVSTPLFVVGVLVTLGLRAWTNLIISAVTLALAWWLIFDLGLGVPLPKGILPF